MSVHSVREHSSVKKCGGFVFKELIGVLLAGVVLYVDY